VAVTTILSDLGNVVVNYDNQKVYRTFASLSGRTPEQVHDILFGKDRNGDYLIARYSSGQISSKQFHCAFLHSLGLCGSIAAHQAYQAGFCDVFTPNQPVVDLWRRLRRQGLTLTAVTNVEPIRFDWLRRLGIIDLFDHCLTSFEERLLKPSEEFMVRALDRSGAKAEETIFVDDLAANLGPAATLGIITHQYVDDAGLESFLRAQGVLP